MPGKRNIPRGCWLGGRPYLDQDESFRSGSCPSRRCVGGRGPGPGSKLNHGRSLRLGTSLAPWCSAYWRTGGGRGMRRVLVVSFIAAAVMLVPQAFAKGPVVICGVRECAPLGDEQSVQNWQLDPTSRVA